MENKELKDIVAKSIDEEIAELDLINDYEDAKKQVGVIISQGKLYADLAKIDEMKDENRIREKEVDDRIARRAEEIHNKAEENRIREREIDARETQQQLDYQIKVKEINLELEKTKSQNKNAKLDRIIKGIEIGLSGAALLAYVTFTIWGFKLEYCDLGKEPARNKELRDKISKKI